MAAYPWSSLGEVLGLRPSTFVDKEKLFAVTGLQDATAYRRFMLDDLEVYQRNREKELIGSTRGVEGKR